MPVLRPRILDEDYNLVIAPIMQRRNEGGALLEVKHGDLAPGQARWLWQPKKRVEAELDGNSIGSRTTWRLVVDM